jgi:hypothetical protein
MVTGCPIKVERGAFRGPYERQETICLTAPKVFVESNPTEMWNVTIYVENALLNNPESIKIIEDLYFATEKDAIDYVKRHYQVDLSIERFKEAGFNVEE